VEDQILTGERDILYYNSRSNLVFFFFLLPTLDQLHGFGRPDILGPMLAKQHFLLMSDTLLTLEHD